MADPDFVARLVRERVPLAVRSLSNLRLNGIDDIGEHPLSRSPEAGIVATVNSNDPAYFGG